MGQFKTPLRYPGGKQRLAPFIREILNENLVDGNYVEPYAGGAGVAIELLIAGDVQKIHLNDSELSVYAFWHSVKNRTEDLCRLISRASLTVEEWRERQAVVKAASRKDLLSLGYSTFYLNRVNRSGMLSGGLIGGVNQNGNYKMDARFNRNDLIRRIEVIAKYSNKIFVSNKDAEDYIQNYIPKLSPNTLVYLDPPYYEKAKDLYLNWYDKSDHTRLAKTIQSKIKHKWILSYDGVPEILTLYSRRRHFVYDLQYNAGNVYKGKEVFVFSDKMKLPQQCVLPHVNEGLKMLVTG
ncbi:MAG: DNA adenine methylase [Chitinophagaceae bacterium]|nr:DNA adenine methylase [Chitinophagaceae bacterium]